MEEKKITKAEFDAAVDIVTNEIFADPDLKGMTKMLVPMTGALFADKMKKHLFGEEENEANERKEDQEDD